MAATATQADNKAVRFRGRAEQEHSTVDNNTADSAPIKHKPKHALSATRKKVPRHMRGRGMISDKAMAAMGEKLAARSKRKSGPQVAAAAKPPPPGAPSRTGKVESGMAKPPKGKKFAAAPAPEA